MLWVLIKMPRQDDSNEYPQHVNVFYLDISTTLQSNSTMRRDKFDKSRGRDDNVSPF